MTQFFKDGLSNQGTSNMVGTTKKIQVDADTEYTLPAVDGDADQVLTTNGSGTLTWSTSSGTSEGGTVKNYIDNPHANVDITGWGAYADAAAVTAADGAGGSPTVTVTRNTTTPLSGDGDILITKDGSNRQGEGVSANFTIDNADKAKKLLVSFDYTTSANYTDDDVKVFVYDVTNTTLIRINGEDLKAISGTGTHHAQFQSSSDSTSYRLIFHCSTTNANAYTINMDTVTVGPIQANTNSSLNGTDIVLIRRHSTGTSIPDATSTVIPFDAALTDTTNSWDAVNYKYVVPETGYYDINAKILYNATSLLDAGEYCNMELLVNTVVERSSDIFESDLSSSVVRVWAQQINTCMHLEKGDEVQFKTYQNSGSAIPLHATAASNYLSIAKRQSASSVTPGASGRDVVLIRSQTSVVSVPDDTKTVIPFNVAGQDTTGGWDSVNYKYVIPETGFYDVDAKILYDGTDLLDANEYCNLELFVNTVVQRSSGVLQSNTSSSTTRVLSQQINTCIYLEKDDEVQFKTKQTSGSTILLHTSAINNYVSIAKRNSAQSILDTETVAMSCSKSDSQTIPSGVTTTWTHNIVDFDTHGGYNTSTGEYTVPVTGIYQINATMLFDPTADWDGGEYGVLFLYINGVNTRTGHVTELQTSNSVSILVGSQLSCLSSLNKGDVVTLRAYQGTGSSLDNLDQSDDNYFDIHKIK